MYRQQFDFHTITLLLQFSNGLVHSWAGRECSFQNIVQPVGLAILAQALIPFLCIWRSDLRVIFFKALFDFFCQRMEIAENVRIAVHNIAAKFCTCNSFQFCFACTWLRTENDDNWAVRSMFAICGIPNNYLLNFMKPAF